MMASKSESSIVEPSESSVGALALCTTLSSLGLCCSGSSGTESGAEGSGEDGGEGGGKGGDEGSRSSSNESTEREGLGKAERMVFRRTRLSSALTSEARSRDEDDEEEEDKEEEEDNEDGVEPMWRESERRVKLPSGVLSGLESSPLVSLSVLGLMRLLLDPGEELESEPSSKEEVESVSEFLLPSAPRELVRPILSHTYTSSSMASKTPESPAVQQPNGGTENVFASCLREEKKTE